MMMRRRGASDSVKVHRVKDGYTDGIEEVFSFDLEKVAEA